MAVCLIGLGSNLGDRGRNLEVASDRLAQAPHLERVSQSTWHETSAVGGPVGQPAYLNGAVVIRTGIPPQELLAVLARIESDMGRVRHQRWGPRTIDLDLLLYDQLQLDTPALVLPHPRMAWRRFVLEPAAEVGAEMIHPTTGWTVGRLLEHVRTAAPYVAIGGAVGSGKTWLANRLAEATSARLVAEPPTRRWGPYPWSDSSGRSWQSAIKFLRARARLLSVDSPLWTGREYGIVSDFWLDQWAGLARIWLPPDEQERFAKHFEQVRGRVVRPKLTVLLDRPIQRLLARLGDRAGRPEMSRVLLTEMVEAIRDQANQRGQGPLLRLTGDEPDAELDEVVAAMKAME